MIRFPNSSAPPGPSPLLHAARRASPSHRDASKAALEESKAPIESTDPQSADARRTVAALAARDRAVRAHEAAHAAAAAGLALGAARLQFVKGPDGQLYAVGGEVRIDTRAGASPEETRARARQIRAAALAPSDPSPQDLAVAARAAAMEAAAQQQVTAKSREALEASLHPTRTDLAETYHALRPFAATRLALWA